MANRKEVAEQNKQAEQVNTQAEQVNTNAQNNNENTQEQIEAPVENKDDAKVNETAENNAPAIVTDKKNEYVIVCLKHPQGIKFKLPDNRYITIHGNAVHLRGQKSPVLPSGGFGMTKILKEDWEYVKTTYGKSMRIFKSGLIFANADAASAESQAKEYDEIKSGFEPIDIEKESKVDALKKVEPLKKDEK